MTEEEVAVRLETHEQNIKSLKHRMDEQEEESKANQKLVLSVQKLAYSVEQMVEEQKEQGRRLEKLEQEPAQNYKLAKRQMLTSIVSVVATALAMALIFAVAANI